MTRDGAKLLYLKFLETDHETVEDAIEAMIDLDVALGMYELDDEPKETE